jgi:hypothetical protein
MADEQPNDVEDVPVAKSAEDRKAASALAKLDARGDDVAAAAAGAEGQIDEKAVSEAMRSLAGDKGSLPVRAAAKNIKVDPADVTLLVWYIFLSLIFC